jgi:hypothetical protein
LKGAVVDAPLLAVELPAGLHTGTEGVEDIDGGGPGDAGVAARGKRRTSDSRSKRDDRTRGRKEGRRDIDVRDRLAVDEILGSGGGNRLLALDEMRLDLRGRYA